jgi:phytoene/squalene synthetase
MQSQLFYQNHLDRVSRSFAFCIANLPQPLRTYVSLSYLLCRLVDTIEDATWTDLNSKTSSFRLFENFLNSRPTAEEVQNFALGLSRIQVSIDELELVNQSHLLFSDFHDLPANIRTKLQRSIVCMSQGMDFFSKQYSDGIRLKSMIEVNQYCFFVAGIVGELLTDLVQEIGNFSNLNTDVYVKSHHFGLFLQKINILKDQKTDEKQGKFFIPNKKLFLESLKYNANQAIQYILQIPVQQKEFRLFCSWSLFLGLSTLSWLKSSPTSFVGEISSKIPRWMTERLLKKTESIIQDNSALLQMFNDLLASSSISKSNEAVKPEHLELFHKFYKGPLKISEFTGLLATPDAV